MGVYKWLFLVLALQGCMSEPAKSRIVYEKLVIEHPVAPVDPIKCPEPKYVLIEYKSNQMVAEPVQDKLDRLICDRDKLRYTQQLLNTIKYYEGVTK